MPGEARALLILELKDLDRAIAVAIPKSADRETRAHFEESRKKIEELLEGDKKE